MNGLVGLIYGVALPVLWAVIVFASFRFGRTQPIRKEKKQKHLAGTSDYQSKFVMRISSIETKGRKAVLTGMPMGGMPRGGSVLYLDRKNGERTVVFVNKVKTDPPAEEGGLPTAHVTISEFRKGDLEGVHGLTNIRDEETLKDNKASEYVRYPIVVRKTWKDILGAALIIVLGVSGVLIGMVGITAKGIDLFVLLMGGLGLIFLVLGMKAFIAEVSFRLTIDQSGKVTFRKGGKTVERNLDDLFFTTQVVLENAKEKRNLTIYDSDKKTLCVIHNECGNFMDVWTVFSHSYEKRREMMQMMNAAEEDERE